MNKIRSLFIILLTIIGVVILGYNFKVAEELKYDFSGDASDFIHLGLSLAKTGRYGHLNLTHDHLVKGFINETHGDITYEFVGHSTWRPPIWPAIVAFCFLISGYSLSFLLIFKFLLHIIGAWFFYNTLRYFEFRKIIIAIGVFLYVVNPSWQLYSRVFLSEPITLFFMTLFIWSLVRFLKTERSLWLNALLGGVLILSHPYYLFLPFSIWFFLLVYKKLNFRKTLAIGGIAVVVVSVWVIRNNIVLDTNKLLITTSSGAVMAKGWNMEVPQQHTNTKGDLADEALVLKNYAYKRADYKGQTGMMELYQDATFAFIKSNPEMIFPIIVKKLKSAFNPFPETPRPGILETGRVIYQVLALVAALFLLIRGSGISRAMVWGLFLSTALITIITYSGFRFRMPQSSMEIIFIVLAMHFMRENYILRRLKPEL